MHVLTSSHVIMISVLVPHDAVPYAVWAIVCGALC